MEIEMQKLERKPRGSIFQIKNNVVAPEKSLGDTLVEDIKLKNKFRRR
jgi:hypothetical protein